MSHTQQLDHGIHKLNHDSNNPLSGQVPLYNILDKPWHSKVQYISLIYEANVSPILFD